MLQFQSLGGQVRVWGLRVMLPDHHKIFRHFVEQVTDGAGECIQSQTRFFDADKLRIVVVEPWL